MKKRLLPLFCVPLPLCPLAPADPVPAADLTAAGETLSRVAARETHHATAA